MPRQSMDTFSTRYKMASQRESPRYVSLCKYKCQVDGSFVDKGLGRRDGDGLGDTPCAVEGTGITGFEASEGRGY